MNEAAPAPRTEAAIRSAHTFDRDAEVVPAEFARELERELDLVKHQNNQLQIALMKAEQSPQSTWFL